MTNSPAQETRDHRFLLGVCAGAAIGAASGAGRGMLFAPRAAVELRGRLADSAKSLGATAANGYRQASARVVAVAKECTDKGQAIRDGLADSVVRGAQSVERLATQAKS